MTIIGDLETIRAKRGLTGKIAVVSGAKRKKPKHVWNHGYELLTGLKSLTTSNSNFAIPGGVVMPNKRFGKIRPGHVMDLLNNVLAEISAIKVKVGVSTPTKIAEMPSGKTPSNVYDAICTAIAMAKSLSAKQS